MKRTVGLQGRCRGLTAGDRSMGADDNRWFWKPQGQRGCWGTGQDSVTFRGYLGRRPQERSPSRKRLLAGTRRQVC